MWVVYAFGKTEPLGIIGDDWKVHDLGPLMPLGIGGPLPLDYPIDRQDGTTMLGTVTTEPNDPVYIVAVEQYLNMLGFYSMAMPEKEE